MTAPFDTFGRGTNDPFIASMQEKTSPKLLDAAGGQDALPRGGKNDLFFSDKTIISKHTHVTHRSIT